MQYTRLIILTIACCACLYAHGTHAAVTFNPDRLITDHELTNAQTMQLGDVQRWLEQRSSELAYTHQPDSAGMVKFPSEILWFAAQEATINPQVLLVMLQKEQSLIDRRSPSQSQYDWAMGYGCPDGTGCNSRFKGFGKQVRGAALQLRGYLDDLVQKGQTIATWAVGRSKQTSDGYTVTPQNRATAALYSYTPWRGSETNIGGNYSFVRLWQSWFGSGRYPDGAVLLGPDGRVWLIRSGKRQHFTAMPVLRSYGGEKHMITVGTTDVEAYAEGPEIAFTNYSVVEDSQGIRYLLVDMERRQIANAAVFRSLGYNPEEVERITSSQLDAFTDGSVISSMNDDPRAQLVLEIGTGVEYAIIGSIRHPIPHPAIRDARYPGQRLRPIQTKELAQYPIGEPLRFIDGELVTSPKYLPQVFVISQGKRRPFANPRALEQLGYSWSNLIVTTNEVLESHPLGEQITGEVQSAEPTTGTGASTGTTYRPPSSSDTPASSHGLSLF
ncbi:MAG: hypothetical protein ABIG71_03950 [Candidatus Uhrbacteria bacterium]